MDGLAADLVHWRPQIRERCTLVPLDIPLILDRLTYRYPSLLVDSIVKHEPGRRITAVKNVTVNEEYFQGHFPGTPLMPGVMMIETLVQVATLLLLDDTKDVPTTRAKLHGVNNAKFRKQVLPGDRLFLEVTVKGEKEGVSVAYGIASVDGETVAEAELLVGLEESTHVDATAQVHPNAVLGEGAIVGPYAIIGDGVHLGRRCRVGASAVIDGDTELGDECQVFPFASVGLIPQDTKYDGEETRLVIGCRNIFREGATVHCGTAGGGGVTRIGDDNFFMAYTHIAHDCIVGNKTIFANSATLAGHVVVEDGATIGAFSAVHQFCRVGREAYIGGYSVVTMDALPYGKTVGSRAMCRLYGVNTIGLERRGISSSIIEQLKQAYRFLLQSKLNTTEALERIDNEAGLDGPEVRYLVEFIRTSKRGVNLRRHPKQAEPVGVED